MRLPPPLHRWDVTPKEAIALQRALANKVRTETLAQPVRHIAGIDVSIRGDRFQTAITVLSYPDLDLLEKATCQGDVPFPYIPGLLSFREMPAIMPALEQLSIVPDIFMTDSQGLAHPRRFGLACHLGVWLGRPAFGVAKTRFIGHHDELPEEKGSAVDLLDNGECIGQVVRTRSKVKPVYVSIGHRVTLQEAVALTLGSATRYKIPEPTRLAHLIASVASDPPTLRHSATLGINRSLAIAEAFRNIALTLERTGAEAFRNIGDQSLTLERTFLEPHRHPYVDRTGRQPGWDAGPDAVVAGDP